MKKFVAICLVTLGGGGIMKKVTNGDIVGRGSKIWHFHGGVIFEWPLIDSNGFKICWMQKKIRTPKIVVLKTTNGLLQSSRASWMSVVPKLTDRNNQPCIRSAKKEQNKRWMHNHKQNIFAHKPKKIE